MNYLRIISAFTLLSAGLSGCMSNKIPGDIFPEVLSITDTGCKNDTKASSDNNAYMYLDYEDSDLVVRLCNLDENCANKNLGFTADVFADGNTISLYINGKSHLANCVCTVEEIKTVIKGLEEGSYEIVVYYDSWGGWKESFNFSKALHKKTKINKWD